MKRRPTAESQKDASEIDSDMLAGKSARKLKNQPFIAEQVAQAVWVNKAFNTIGRVAEWIVGSSKFVDGNELLKAQREPTPKTYIALICNGLQLMADSIEDPDGLLGLKVELLVERKREGQMKVMMKTTLRNAESMKGEYEKTIVSLKRDLDLAVALMRPQERLEFFKQRAKLAVIESLGTET